MSEINMNEEVVMVVEDATVITTPIDDTLTVSGDAADAKAVGDALALKADKSQLTSVSVNGQDPDAQGAILIAGTDIPANDETQDTVADALAALDAKTGADIAINTDEGAASISDTIGDIQTALENDSLDRDGFTMGANITKRFTAVHKIGNFLIVTVAGTLGDNADIKNSTVLCTIPEDYWPGETKYAVSGTVDRNGLFIPNRFGEFTLNAAGEIKQGFTNAWTSGGFGVTFAYHVPTAD